MIYKILSDSISITTADSVSNAAILRLVNPTTGVVNCTISVNASVNVASFSLLGNSEIIIEKIPTYRVQGTGVVASSIAFRY